MVDDEDGLWAKAEIPDWPTLHEAPAYIFSSFGYRPELIIPILLRDLKGGRITHRIQGLEPVHGPRTRSLPDGFESVPLYDRRITKVIDWDVVGFDPAIGTVAGRSSGKRHVIEVEWRSVERWAITSQILLRRLSGDASRNSGSKSSQMLREWSGDDVQTDRLSSEPSDDAPSGFMFIDDAIAQVRQRAACPMGPAVKMLLEAIRAGNPRTWMRHHTGPTLILPADWTDGYIDPDAFAARQRGGIRFQGSEYHMHRFLIAEDELGYWLGSLAPIKDNAGAGQKAGSSPSLRRAAIGGGLPRGRKPKYQWESVITGLSAKLSADGLPKAGDGGQAKLEEWVSEQFPIDRCPSQSLIREK